jgi:hypothetical protein
MENLIRAVVSLHTMIFALVMIVIIPKNWPSYAGRPDTAS